MSTISGNERRISWNNFNLGLTTSNVAMFYLAVLFPRTAWPVNTEIKVVHVPGYFAVKPHSVLN